MYYVDLHVHVYTYTILSSIVNMTNPAAVGTAHRPGIGGRCVIKHTLHSFLYTCSGRDTKENKGCRDTIHPRETESWKKEEWRWA